MSRENRSTTSSRRSQKPKSRERKQAAKRGISTKSSFLEVQRHIKNNHVVAARKLRRMYSKEDLSHRELTWKMAAWAYALAMHLDDGERWHTFVNELFWDGHSRLNHEHVLRYSLIYIYGSHEDETIVNRARDHARCLKPLWDAGTKPREVYATLKRQGFAGLKQSTNSTPPPDGTWVARSFLTGPNGRRQLDMLAEGEKALIQAVVILCGGKRVLKILRVKPRGPSVSESSGQHT